VNIKLILMKDIYYNVQTLQVWDHACFFSTGFTRSYSSLTPSEFYIDDVMSFEKWKKVLGRKI